MRSFWMPLSTLTMAVLAISISQGQVLQRPKVQSLPNVLTKPKALESAVSPTATAGKAVVIDLGLPDGASDARDINESGMALVNNLDKKTCFVWSPAEGFKPVLAEGGNFQLEDGASVTGVVGRGLNNKGQVAGNVVLSDGRVLAFFWDPETGMRLIGTLAGGNQSVAVDVSDTGIVAGSSLATRSKATQFIDTPEVVRFKEGCAFAWAEDMGMVPIGRFGTKSSWATAVNSKGVVAGSFGSNVYGIETMQSFLWSREDGAEVVYWRLLYSDSDRVSAGACMVHDLRDDGTMSLYYYHYSTEGDKPYPGRLNTAIMARNGRVQYEFKSPGMDIPYKIFPLGLNDADFCVGFQENRGSQFGSGAAAFAWRPGAQITDLNALTNGWAMARAYRINSKNQVVGIGTHDGKTKGFIMNLTPALLPTPLSKGLTQLKSGAKLTKPIITKPPK